MQLVYLWVEEYKNIKRQGFNLSPQYKCKFFPQYEKNSYDDILLKNGCSLQIIKEDSYENIFPENLNISAIVGVNGSGKSSIAKIIFFLIAHRYYNDPNHRDSSAPARLLKDTILEGAELILILYDNGFKKITFRHYSVDNGSTFGTRYFSGGIITVDSNVPIEELPSNEINFFSIHFNYMLDTWFDGSVDNWVQGIYHRKDGYATPLLLEPYKGHNKQQIDIDNLEYLNTQKIRNLYEDVKDNKSLISFFNPQEIKYKLGFVYAISAEGNYERMPKLVDKYLKLLTQYKIHEQKVQKRIIDHIKSLYTKLDFDNINKLYIIFKALDSDESYLNKEILDFLKNRFPNISTHIDLMELTRIPFEQLVEEKGYPETAKIEKCIEFLIFQDFHKLNEYIDQKVNIFEIQDIFQMIPPWMDTNFYEGSKQLKSLSSGEKMLFFFIVNLLYQVKFIKSSYDTINLYLDEVEFGLHPNWQKRLVSEIVYSLKNFDTKFNIFLMSHSPFILSDIPKDNVIFIDKIDQSTKNKYPQLNLESLKNGNCINVTEHIDINPFGANIHNLLADGFFMKEGLIGDFAKERIQSAIDILIEDTPNMEKKTEVQNIIKYIGEPFLKSKLEDMFDEVYLSDKERNQKIKKLERELERLRNAENRKK